MKELETIITLLDVRIRTYKEKLSNQLEHTINVLNITRCELEETIDDSTEYGFNQLGILQATGPSIDTRCGQLGEMIQIYQGLVQQRDAMLDNAIAETEKGVVSNITRRQEMDLSNIKVIVCDATSQPYYRIQLGNLVIELEEAEITVLASCINEALSETEEV